jgi:uncharacterized surface protein with fasciclin (FAS1) repeats
MRTNYATIIIALAIGAAVLICGCMGLSGGDARNQTNGTPVETPFVESLAINEVLDRDGNFSTFTQAIEAAGLEGMLAGPGPYTVFAPTDEAFSRISNAVMEELFSDPKGNLAEVLLYHMAPGDYMASGMATNEIIATVQGNSVTVDAAGDGVRVNGAEVVRVDILAANGVIHAIDAVMLPPDITLLATNETMTDNTTNVTG